MAETVYPAAAIFDLDGVVTFTARVHAAAWKELFDSYMQSRAQRNGETFRPFDADKDYRAYVDGRPRYEGVRVFLESRGIHLPYGTPDDSPDLETVSGLGNRKNALFVQKTKELGVDMDEDAVRFIRDLKAMGVKVGLASSSKNAVPILERCGIADLFEQVVDGLVSERLRLQGKPQPDIFLKCLEMLGGDDPDKAMVVEDAIAGVQAGRLGGFGLVLGVDRHGESDSLRQNGANQVIQSFKDISAEAVSDYFRTRAKVA